MTALYKVIQQEERGLSICDDSWGMQQNHKKGDIEITDMILWNSCDVPRLPSLPSLSKKRKYIWDESIPHGEVVRHDLRNERGWKGRIRLLATPIRFCDLKQRK